MEGSPRRRALADYVKWRGDLSFVAAPLCEVDLLILSQLAYLHFGDVTEDGAITFHTAASLLEKLPTEPGNSQTVANRHRLLEALADTKRFGGLTILHCEDRFDPELHMQFAAVTFLLPDGSPVIAYRGTDATVVGWREDFNLSFSSPVPSQVEAVRYLQAAIQGTRGGLCLCGHSKGGNLAMYTAAYCEPQERERITDVYLFDAPGQDNATLALAGYREALLKARCYVPQSSVIGRLMGVPETYRVVHSHALGISQHDVFTWVLDGPHFETLPTLDRASRLTKATMDEFLRGSTPETRKLFIDTLFSALGAGSALTMSVAASRLPDTASALWAALRAMDLPARKAMLSVLSTMATSGVESAKRLLTDERGTTDLSR